MITISLCMIVKDEEMNINNCLNSVCDLVDEIIIVDTGSTDKTKEVVRKYTDKIYDFQWINDFSAARNYSFSLATKEYILWLDADDVFLEIDRNKLKELKSKLDENTDYVNMIYDIAFNQEGTCILSTIRERLIKNFKGFYWDCFMHERLNLWGNQEFVDIHITHRKNHHESKRNLENFQKKLKDKYFLNPREIYFYGAELYLGRYYDEAIRVLEDFLRQDYENNFDRTNGLRMLSECYENKNNYEKALDCCFRTFLYETPKEDTLYKIGYYFQCNKKISEAIFWYNMVLDRHTSISNTNSQQTNWINYLPHQQLVMCYYQLGDIESAYSHNELAAKYLPKDSSILYNREFFREQLKNRKC